MKRRMRKPILIAGVAICIICAAVVFYSLLAQRDAIPLRDLTLNEYPKLFAKESVIVVGEQTFNKSLTKNAAQIEMESAEAIAANLEYLTGNKPGIISSKKIESFKYSYNLIIVGTLNSNEVLEGVYNMTDAIRVTDEYPGAGKGMLETLRNPWNPDKALLIVAGSDEWGVKAGSEVLKQAKGNESRVIVKWEDSKANIIKFDFLPNPYGLNNSKAVKFALSKKCGEDWNKKYQIGSYYNYPAIPLDHKLIRIDPPDFCILVTTEKIYFLSIEKFNEFLEIYGNEYVQTEAEAIEVFSLYLKLYGLYDESVITPYYQDHRWALILEERYNRNFTDLSNMSIQKQDECWRLECYTVSQSATDPHTKPSPIDVVITRHVAEVGFKGNINILKTESERYGELIPAGPR